MKEEKSFKPINGYLMLTILLVLIAGLAYGVFKLENYWFFLLGLPIILILPDSW